VKTVLLVRYRAHTYGFLAHLVARGSPVTHVIFEGKPVRGLKEKVLGVAENLYLGLVHAAFLRGHPSTESVYMRRYGDVERLLDGAGIKRSIVGNHNDEQTLELLQKESPDVLVLYGARIIKEPVLKTASIGVLNIHSALLPTFRGGKSEFWILFHEQPERFGLTVHWVVPGLDAGDMFLQERIPVLPSDTPRTLRAKAQIMAPVVLAEALRRIADGEILRIPQKQEDISVYRAPTPEQIAAYAKKFPGRKIF